MTLADKALSAVGTARTFWANFSIPCVWIAVIASGVAGTTAWKIKGRLDKGDIQEAIADKKQAQLDLSKFTATLATNAATAEEAAAKRLKETSDAQAARDKAIQQQIANIPSMVARQLQPDFDVFRSAIHADPDLEACLLRPMPPGALGVLRRPGGDSSTATSN